MASAGKTKHEQALLEGLRHAVHGLRAPFTCGGTLVLEQPVTLCFPDNTQVRVLRAKDTFEQGQLLRSLVERCAPAAFGMGRDRKSTRLNSSHGYISYAVFCLKKKHRNVDCVQLSAAEPPSGHIGTLSADSASSLRDMRQPHLLHLLPLTLTQRPAAISAPQA